MVRLYKKQNMEGDRDKRGVFSGKRFNLLAKFFVSHKRETNACLTALQLMLLASEKEQCDIDIFTAKIFFVKVLLIVLVFKRVILILIHVFYNTSFCEKTVILLIK